MKDILIGVGEGMGIFQDAKGELRSGVMYAGHPILLPEERYKVWQVAKFAAYSLEDFSKLLDMQQINFQGHLKALMKQGLIIKSSEISSRIFLTNHTAIPKGNLVSIENGEWQVTEFSDAPIVSLPLMAVTVWRLANPLFSLKKLVEDLIQVIGISEEVVLKMITEAIPYLVGNGLLTIDQRH